MKQLTALVALLLLAGTSAGQSTQPPPSKSPEPRKGGETRLNLRLDDAELRSLSRDAAPPRDRSSQKGADGLPGLGDDARRVERKPADVGSGGGPYPADVELERR